MFYFLLCLLLSLIFCSLFFFLLCFVSLLLLRFFFYFILRFLICSLFYVIFFNSVWYFQTNTSSKHGSCYGLSVHVMVLKCALLQIVLTFQRGAKNKPDPSPKFKMMLLALSTSRRCKVIHYTYFEGLLPHHVLKYLRDLCIRRLKSRHRYRFS